MLTWLVDNVSWLLVSSSVTSIIFNFLNIGDIWRRAWIWWSYTRKSTRTDPEEDEFFPTFQIHLNKSFELTEFDIAARYSYYIGQIYTAAFYGYLIPIGIPVVLITFIVQYWVDKFNLFKRSSLKYEVSHDLTSKMFKLLQFSVPIYAIGMLLFSIEINEGITIFPLLAVAISFLFVFISNALPRKWFKRIY